MKRLKWGD